MGALANDERMLEEARDGASNATCSRVLWRRSRRDDNIGSHETGGIWGDDRRGGRPFVACGGLRLRGAVVVVPKASTGHAKREKAGPRQAEPQHQDPAVIADTGRQLGRRFREYDLLRRCSGRQMQMQMQMVSTAISSE
jgi:hypothetical protein